MAVTLVQDNTLQYKVPTSIELYDSSYQTSDLTDIYTQILSVAESVFSDYYPCIVFPQTFLSIDLNGLYSSVFSNYIFPRYFYLGCCYLTDQLQSSYSTTYRTNLSTALTINTSSIDCSLNYCYIGSSNYFVYSNKGYLTEYTLYSSGLVGGTGITPIDIKTQSFSLDYISGSSIHFVKTKLIYIFKIEYNIFFTNIIDSSLFVEDEAE